MTHPPFRLSHLPRMAWGVPIVCLKLAVVAVAGVAVIGVAWCIEPPWRKRLGGGRMER